ncbi:MAG: kynurenine 3-monooxygenase [Cognaticolwellia sp.]
MCDWYNIALSDRGWLTLATVGIEAEIKQHAIDGTITEQAYGQEEQAI